MRRPKLGARRSQLHNFKINREMTVALRRTGEEPAGYVSRMKLFGEKVHIGLDICLSDMGAWMMLKPRDQFRGDLRPETFDAVAIQYVHRRRRWRRVGAASGKNDRQQTRTCANSDEPYSHLRGMA